MGIRIYWSDRSSGRPRTYRKSSFDTRGFLGAGFETDSRVIHDNVYGMRVYAKNKDGWKSKYTNRWYLI